MRADYSLAWRIARGGGASGLGRMALLATGLALALTTVLFVSQVPTILAARSESVTSRAPVPAVDKGQDADFEFAVAESSWGAAPLRRVFLVGTSTSTPPPGLDAFPMPGETALSPRARELIGSDAFAAMVPGEVRETVGAEGLTDPNELFAYVGVEAADAPTLRRAIGWGLPTGTRLNADLNPRLLPLELAVLVLPSLVVSVLAAGRLAASTRRRRNAALQVMGASRATMQRVSFMENGVATVFGTVVGIGLYELLDAPLGRSGWLGVSWFPEQSSYNPGSVLLLVLGALVVARLAAYGAWRRAAVNPLSERNAPIERKLSFWTLVPLVLGVGLLSPWLPVFGATEPQRNAEPYVLAGTILCVVGTLLAARFLVTKVAGVGERASLPLGVRLGASRITTESASAVRLSSGLAFLVLVGASATGITTGAEARASSDSAPIRVHVYGDEVSPAHRDQVRGLGADGGSWSTVTSVVKMDQEAYQDDVAWKADHFGVRVLVADCSTVERLFGTRLSRCEQGRLYRLRSKQGDFALPADFPVTFAGESGPRVLDSPVEQIRVTGDSPLAASSQLLYTGAALPGGWYPDTTFFFRIPAGLDALDQFSSRLSAVAPTSVANASIDLSAVFGYRMHRAAIRVGVGFAFALAVLASLVTLIDRNVNRRGLVTSLVTLGTPTRTLRAAQTTYSMVPYLALSALTLPVGLIVANAFVNVDTGRGTWLWEPLWSAIPLLAMGAAGLLLASLLVFGLSLRSEDLRHE